MTEEEKKTLLAGMKKLSRKKLQYSILQLMEELQQAYDQQIIERDMHDLIVQGLRKQLVEKSK